MNVILRVLRYTVADLTRIACLFALAALALMAVSIIWPRPLPVILAMSLGQVLGGAAFGCYVLAVLLDVARARRARNSLAPPSGPLS